MTNREMTNVIIKNLSDKIALQEKTILELRENRDGWKELYHDLRDGTGIESVKKPLAPVLRLVKK